MKTILHVDRTELSLPQTFAWAMVFGAILIPSAAWAQSDNFDSGTDSAWQHADVLAAYGGPNTYSFPSGPFGKGYRVQCTTSAVLAGACGDCGTARAYAYRTNVYSDFYVAADIVNWDNTLDQALVLGARIVGVDVSADPCPLPGPCPPGFATTSGYVCNYDCNQDGATAGDRLGGEFQINRVDQEAPSTLAAAEVTLIPGKAYRIVFQGVGSLLTGQLYDLEDLSAPIVTIQAQDTAYPSGVSGLVSFSRDATTTDVTFDNYQASVANPNADIAPAIRHPVAGTPQVVNRTPASRFTTLYPSPSGITFTVRTFATNEINAGATKLFLNGADVSASLVPAPGSGTNITYTLSGGTLVANTVYVARIEVQDTSGALKSTNIFWFDTFSNSFLTSAPVKTVEVEDYNYSNGVYQLDPIPISGIDTNGLQVGLSGGYYVLDGTPEVDYHDNRTSPEGGWNDYRPDDFVGTLQGNREDIEDLNHPTPTTPPVSDPTRPDDGPRPQYAAAHMKEYEVARTEAGEWLNYTRVFADTNYYVYLRCGSFGVQDVSLDLVGGDPTTTNQTTSPLGTFSVPNHLMRLNYRFEPLTVGGSPAVVHLGGTNTLRLTIGGKPAKDNRLLSLNYLLFVPAGGGGVAIFDNFNDGNDTTPSPAWMRYDPIQVGAWSFPDGNSYRIQSGPSPDPGNFGQGRAGSVKPSSFSDFYISVDVVGWDDSIHQVFGVLARIGTPGPGTTTGYMFSHDRGNPTSDTSGDMDIIRLDNEAVTTLDPSGAPDSIHFETNKQYRIVFMGVGNNLTGQVYELPNTTVPVVSYSTTDDTYTNGSVGLVVANNSTETGYDGPADATFDNFLATTAEPRITTSSSPSGFILSWPLIGFVLQTSPSLSSPTWTTVTSGINQSSGTNVYKVPTTGVAGYYRLSTQ